MRVFGITGWRDSGKTTLLENLVRHFTAAGLRVSTVKHAHHGFDLDHPGKDSFRHRAAGAREVLVSSAGRWALLHELPQGEELPLDRLLARLESVDLVLVEGFKGERHPKLEVVRIAPDRPAGPSAADEVMALAASDPSQVRDLAAGRPIFALEDLGAIAAFVLENAREPALSTDS